jgi:Ras-related protein Rab-8A
VSLVPAILHHLSIPLHLDIRTWHSNIEQHASEGVNKILIGNKSDWNDKRVITEQQGRELAQELGIQFMETSAKVNEGVEEAFFTLARYLSVSTFKTTTSPFIFVARDIKTRLIDSQADSNSTVVGSTEGSVKINQNNDAATGSCC